MQDLSAVFAECYRVLRPNSRLVMFTSTPEMMQTYWLNHYFPKMMSEGANVMTSVDKLRDLLTAVGLTTVATESFIVDSGLCDWFLQAGKYTPERYLDPTVRAGMSVFAKTAFREEVNAGLSALKDDIQSNRIQSIIERYEDKAGDYLFVSAEKSG